MSKPFIHAHSSAKKYGGKMEDYLPLHDFMDSSKGAIASNVHRALTHNSWFISNVIEKVFGFTAVNSDGKTYSTRDIAEQHVLEDLGFIPTACDYLAEMELKAWMGGACPEKPNSYRPMARAKKNSLDIKERD
jgi:hypothetical protein